MSKLNQVWGTWKELETERYEKEFCGKIYFQTVPKQAVKSPMYASQEPSTRALLRILSLPCTNCIHF